jgi:hypothetical protein
VRAATGLRGYIVHDRNENLSAAVMAAVGAVVMLACLAVALARSPAPPRLPSAGPVLPLLALAALLPLSRWAERSRIRKAVEAGGGRVLRLRRLPFWRQCWSRSPYQARPRYALEYADLLGRVRRGICRTSMLYGVELPPP